MSQPSSTIECPEATEHGFDSPAVDAPRQICKVAYLMSRFPKLTETFVLYEMIAVERQGVDVEIFPLLGGSASGKEVAGAGLFRKLKDYLSASPKPKVMHAEAEGYVAKARYMPFVNGEILLANLQTFFQQPLCYLSTLWQIVRWNLGNRNFLVGGLTIYPKCVAFARQMKRDNVEHIHAHFANHPAMAAYVIHRLTNIPFSFTAHGSDLHRFKHMLREKVAHAAFVVTISSYNRDQILQHCGQKYAEKINIIHCGVDLEKFRSLPERQQETIRSLNIICVGTLHEVKGQRYLIEALDQLTQQGIDAQVSFVGDGSDLEMLQELTQRLSLESRVTFHGTKTRDELVELLRNSDVLATPSVPTSDGRREGIPVALMEGMACGLPVVASRLSGIPELVNSDAIGFLVSPKDVAGFADAFAKLAADPQLRQSMGQHARERIMEDFDLHQNAEQLVSLFGSTAVSR